MSYHNERQDYLAYKRHLAEQKKYRKNNPNSYSHKKGSDSLTNESAKESDLEKSLMCCSPQLGLINSIADEICSSNCPEPPVQA